MLVSEMEERARSEQERLDLLKQIFTIQEAERGRIARDIHDQLGQRVTALRFKTAIMKEACGDDEQLARQADELQEIALQLDHEVSFVAWELRPSILDDLSFAEALENFVTEWSRHSGIAAEFHVTGPSELTIGRDVETNMYRIVQEALNNAAKHSKATQVNVLLERRLQGLTLIVEDNGVGIGHGRPGREGLKGLGLRGMRERASLVGGTLEIESSKTGTSLFIRIRLSPSDDERKPELV
jgi:signal transduction histidine kinase